MRIQLELVVPTIFDQIRQNFGNHSVPFRLAPGVFRSPFRCEQKFRTRGVSKNIDAHEAGECRRFSQRLRSALREPCEIFRLDRKDM